METLFLSLIDGNLKDLGQGGLISILAIVLVFSILALIIAITYCIGKSIEKYSITISNEKQEVATTKIESENKQNANLSDEDAVVAALVASIDYRNEIKKDIKVVSIKEIK